MSDIVKQYQEKLAEWGMAQAFANQLERELVVMEKEIAEGTDR